MSSEVTIFWFRQDLRLSDNPGLTEAAQQGRVLPIYILDDEGAGEACLGGASRWWLHHSLKELDRSLGGVLRVFRGNSAEVLLSLCQEYKPKGVYWNRCYEPWRIREDTLLKARIRELGISCQSFNGSLLWEPWEILKADQTYYKVFTPYYKNGCLKAPAPRRPLPIPEKMCFIQSTSNLGIESLGLLPKIHWYQTMEKVWNIGEKAAQERLDVFLDGGLKGYQELRNIPSQPHVSRLSPHLHFGEISPHQVCYAAQSKGMSDGMESDLSCFMSELGWREFSYYLLYHFPDLPHRNFQAKFDQFPWEDRSDFLEAWQQGKTGYPIVDAGMRELWQTGYMHNRVRMIVGSFLVKNLGIHWRQGESWFWDCLVDADLASNSASWQWVAGTGADAAPYFRIFNPVLQGEKFDPEGTYTRKYVPELARVPQKYLHQPWVAPKAILAASGVVLGQTYPNPIVDWVQSRERALSGLNQLGT